MARPGIRRVHWGSFGSFGSALGLVGFILARPCGRSVHSGPLPSLGHAQGIVRLNGFRWVHSGAPMKSQGKIGFVG